MPHEAMPITDEYSRDQRKSYRCSVASTCQQCELVVDGCAVPAKLLDESAGGFSVLAKASSTIEDGQTVQLRTGGGAFHARVVHVQEVMLGQPDDDEAEVDEGNSTDELWVRLGLRRLGEVEPEGHPTLAMLATSLGSRLTHTMSGGLLPTIVLGSVLALVVAVVPWIMLSTGLDVVSETPGGSSAGDQSRRPDAERKMTSDEDVFGKSAGGPTAEAFPAAGSKRDSMLDLPGAAPLLLPDVVGRLELTDSQRKQIETIIEETSDAIRRLSQELRGAGRQKMAQRRQELLDRSRRDAISVLTDEQRADWDKLIGK